MMNPWPLFWRVLRGVKGDAAGWVNGSGEEVQADEPLRAELFSIDQMELHGRTLASAHILNGFAIRDRLLGRLDDNEQVLIGTCNLLTAAVKARSRIAPAGEWLLDNFYLIEEQIRTARLHLPKRYSQELPHLARGPSRGLPRVYDLALETISHGDGRIDAETLIRFVAAYQSVNLLKLGELWAIPIMLRLALVENLRRVGARITASRLQVNQAQAWASQMIEIAASDPKSLILVIADMARSDPPMVSPFVAELARQLQGHGQALALPLTWIEQRLAESGRTIEQLVFSENQQQAADQVSISNTIASLRFLGATDWREFVEKMSAVEEVLLQDLGELNASYRGMDFTTRDRYRHVVARLAKSSLHSEVEVARAAIGLASRSAAAKGNDDIAAHVGYYLIDRGFAQLQATVAGGSTAIEKLRFGIYRSPLGLYLGAIVLMVSLMSGMLLFQAYGNGVSGLRLMMLGVLSTLVSSHLASALANWLVTVLITPQLLPRMDFSQGLPPEGRTLVIVPTLLVSAENVDALVEEIEVRYLANQDAHVHCGLLTDLCDAADEILIGDEPLLRRARKGIEALNRKYRETGSDRFFLLHRPRRWNPSERKWMGFERKRGKLAELNALLRGEGCERFSLVVGDLECLKDVRYVITLDSDTTLPRDSVRKFAGTMAHPLNRPRYDTSRRVVSAGYGILQPRMAATLSAANRSRYATLYGNDPGIDPYTRSVSDVYQDLFGEGSFIGKGIYDVDAFEYALKARFPDNRILSHDLLEGCYARSGLLSDLHLFEEYPARYLADADRQRRWIRGDWQIAHWLLPKVPGPRGAKLDNPLSALSRWKIFDNLRRSLIPAALTLLLLLGWSFLPQPWLWTLAIVGVIAMPSLLVAMVAAFRRPSDLRLSEHLASVAHSAGLGLAQSGFRIACIPHETLFSLDAIFRTLWRMLIQHRGLLEWSAYGASEDRLTTDCRASYRSMAVAPALAIITAMGLLLFRPEALVVAAPILCLWLVAPGIAWWLSQRLVRREPELSAEQTLFLRRMARKTWAFFEEFVVAEEHWLPPDNFQELPGPTIAHRTSPTNIGLALLANLSAYDFGFIPAGGLIDRTARTFATMAEMERHQGHFYNWYDTRSLRPLPPRYLSSVDSGNLAGHLLTLRAGLLALPDQRIVSVQLFAGLSDTLALAAEAMTADGDGGSGSPLLSTVQLEGLLAEAGARPPVTLQAVVVCLQTIADGAMVLVSDIRREFPAAAEASPVGVATQWAVALSLQCQQMLDELALLAPWLTMPTASAAPTAATFEGAAELSAATTMRELVHRSTTMLLAIDARLTVAPPEEAKDALIEWRTKIESGRCHALDRIAAVEQLAQQATGFATMEYEFLYDRGRHLLAIGYNVDEFRRDTSYYDLLASEARLGSFIAIAQGQLPQENWFALGRLLTSAGGEPVLVSWSGSMFEYLMPLLVMPAYDDSLLDQTCRAAVARQIAYGNQRGLPWGVSESGYNTVDASLNYQYHAFGVPGLGLKRGLAEDSVVAPYASALALMVAPEAACANLQRLAACGLDGRFGFYEAIDYTPSRLLRGQSATVIRSFMAHHQGMTLAALAHLLLDRPMQRRFESDPALQATLLLLQERTVKTALFQLRIGDQSEASAHEEPSAISVQGPIDAVTPAPEVQLLSNGRYHVMLTNAGGGYSRWKDIAITRWREDATRDHWGAFVYVCDVIGEKFWSVGYQPTLKRADSFEAVFSEGRAEYRRRDNDIETYAEIVVSPEDDIELRRLRISNRSRTPRTLEVTSYAEVVLAAPAADAMQPSFGNLFVQTEWVERCHAILCARRPRSSSDPTPWMFHLLATNGHSIGDVSCETDRMRFTGRGRSLDAPSAMDASGVLSGSAGSVLDPIVAIRCRITIAPGESVTLDWVTGAADSRSACMALVEKYQDRHLANRVFDLAGTHAGVTLRQINATESDAELYRRLAGPVLYANIALRAEAGILVQNRRGQSGLWGYAISGDLPIVLLKIAQSEHIELARQLIQCHAYWRLKGLVVDLVIWNEEHVSYRQQLQDQIMGLIATGTEPRAIDRPGGIFVRSGEQISQEDRILLMTVARVIIVDSRGSLSEQVSRRSPAEKSVARLIPIPGHRLDQPAAAPPRQDLILGNDYGGFSADGREYVITTTKARRTPVPWVNVLANPNFGAIVTESGPAYTWSENAHEFRLTPWSDDPVGASVGEAFYLRDEESGIFWSPTPLPRDSARPYVCRHGFGYSVFEHTANGIRSELWIYVDIEDAVKFSVLKVRNLSGRARRLSATGYVEWVLGDLRPKTAMHVVTSIETGGGPLFASNAYNTEFSGRFGFFDVDDPTRSLSCDRGEFLGRNGSLANPDGMTRVRLSGRLGAGLDPCAAMQVHFELADGQEREIVFRLGAGRDIDDVRELAQRLRSPGSAHAALMRVRSFWSDALGAVQVQTPDPALNVLANGWLVYQTLACRLWARSGYSQSGGAFGFRDQLQDAMALVHTKPMLVREHLLRCAQRQFPEGDVQHWWHPPVGRGVRTRCSDDYLWLPLAVCRYVSITGDVAVLDESLHFLEGRSLDVEEESYYDLPGRAAERASLYQHCVRAIEHGLRFGEHGLPLMGSGDWNDGMNLVGIHGKGESVWLGFFLHQVLTSFIDVARDHHDLAFAERCREEAAKLRGNLAQHGWDGAWYRRAWFDDGTPLGSSINSECRIDSIAQSWSVLSGAGDAERSRLAMEAVDRHLVRRGADGQGLVQLLDPPFDQSEMNPGYIKGYVPGVRENGGQYTHAAIWAAMAFARLGDGARAWELMALINPVNHARSAQDVATYKAEPYVVAADIYAVAPHTGRAGWTWYTGSAGWLYRLILESLLGLNRNADRLFIKPCLPAHWTAYSLTYRYGQTEYRIAVSQRSGAETAKACSIMLDGVELEGEGIPLRDDRQPHQVEVRVVAESRPLR